MRLNVISWPAPAATSYGTTATKKQPAVVREPMRKDRRGLQQVQCLAWTSSASLWMQDDLPLTARGVWDNLKGIGARFGRGLEVYESGVHISRS